MTQLPYQDATLTPEQRTDDLLARLTIEEKAGQLTQYFYFGTGELPDEDTLASLPPEARTMARQPAMVENELDNGHVGSLLFVRNPALANRLQRKAVAGSRLGIPLIFGFDVIHGLRTILPAPIALAASWSPETIAAGQAVAAREARAVGISWTFAPMVDIARDPRWGPARIPSSARRWPQPRSAASSQPSTRVRASSPARSTSPATALPAVAATTTTPRSPTPSFTTSTCRRSGPRWRPAPATS